MPGIDSKSLFLSIQDGFDYTVKKIIDIYAKNGSAVAWKVPSYAYVAA